MTYAYNPGGKWTGSHQMTVNGKREGFTEDDLKQCGENMNINAKKCGEIIAEVRAAVMKWHEFDEDAGLPEDECESISKVLLV